MAPKEAPVGRFRYPAGTAVVGTLWQVVLQHCHYELPGVSQKILFADKLRGLAALSVVISHFAYGFWAYEQEVARLIGAPPLSATTPIVDFQKIWLPEGFFGHFGVALFFLISGFVVPFGLLDRSRLDFAMGRVFRIWPTYAAGLAITVTLVVLSARYFGAPLPFSWATAVLQLLMIRDLFWVPSIDGIVWTLEIEVKFYLLCLVIASALRRGSVPLVLTTGLALAAFSISCALLLPDWLTSGAPLYRVSYALFLSAQMITFMLIGVTFNFHYRGLVSGRLGLLLGSVFLVATLLQWAFGPIRSSLAPGSISYALGLTVFTAAYVARNALARPSAALGFLARISYPLYVVHGVGGYVIMRIAVDRGLGALGATSLALTYSILAATLLHKLIEEPSRLWFRHRASLG